MKSIFTFILLLVMTASTAFAQSDQYLMSTEKLELRSGPGYNYNIIGEITKGTQVYVINSGYGEWSTVQYKNTNGFVLTKLLTEDSRIADAEKAAQEEAARAAAAKAAAAKAIADAEEAAKKAAEAARLAIARAEAAKRQAEADAAAAIAKAEAAKRDKDIARRNALKDTEETRRALAEAQKRASQSGTVASTPIESTTDSFGASSEPEKKAAPAPSKVTREDKFSSWEKKNYKSGATPKSFGKFKGKFDYKLDNYLKINVGKNTQVVVKLIKMGKTEKDDETIRVTYINSNATQYIRNIPEGEYYCVIAYGKEWKETTQNGKVLGSFTKNALYEKGADVLNYNAIKTDKGINIPSYTLSLDLLPNGTLGYDGNDDNIKLEEFQSY
ncbi:SH3 domain-containing protein [Aquimarina sp. 2201CG5-10]|uniref:SH3 domain-containing protein n=1 Tax=Aquimarina callyspongiae TaxID=3098150 RepID=UPI002AB4E2CF|nr:SH3 domain-containing protein [Aquimarina sp. 2201CG5-10]MDY8134381.1 hypothetical protein [Aquimarina sp. 2201CG5-10]